MILIINMSQKKQKSQNFVASARKSQQELMDLRNGIQDIYESQIKGYNDICIADFIKSKKQNTPEDNKSLKIMQNMTALSESIIDPNGSLYNRKRSEKIKMEKRASKISTKEINDMSLYFFEQLLEGDRSNFEQVEYMPEVQLLEKISNYKDITSSKQLNNSR